MAEIVPVPVILLDPIAKVPVNVTAAKLVIFAVVAVIVPTDVMLFVPKFKLPDIVNPDIPVMVADVTVILETPVILLLPMANDPVIVTAPKFVNAAVVAEIVPTPVMLLVPRAMLLRTLILGLPDNVRTPLLETMASISELVGLACVYLTYPPKPAVELKSISATLVLVPVNVRTGAVDNVVPSVVLASTVLPDTVSPVSVPKDVTLG